MLGFTTAIDQSASPTQACYVRIIYDSMNSLCYTYSSESALLTRALGEHIPQPRLNNSNIAYECLVKTLLKKIPGLRW